MATAVAHISDDLPSQGETLTLESTGDFQYEELARKLRGNKTVTSLHIKEGVLANPDYRSPTWKRLKLILQSVASMVNLKELGIHGRMSLDNIHDVQIIAKAILQLPELRDLRLHGFVTYAKEDKDGDPLLEPLIAAAATIQNLEALDLQCHATYRRWSRSFVSTDALIPICRSTKLQRLSLSNIGLQDQHLVIISQELLANEESALKELILTNNHHSDIGIDAMTSVLLLNRSLERLELYNHHRVGAATCERILERVDKNHMIKYLTANVQYSYRTELDFFLLLNRAGRKVLLDPDVIPEEAVDVLAAANGNISVLMHFLRENPSICKEPVSETDSILGSANICLHPLPSSKKGNVSCPICALAKEQSSDDSATAEEVVKDQTLNPPPAQQSASPQFSLLNASGGDQPGSVLSMLEDLAVESAGIIWKRFWYRSAYVETKPPHSE